MGNRKVIEVVMKELAEYHKQLMQIITQKDQVTIVTEKLFPFQTNDTQLSNEVDKIMAEYEKENDAVQREMLNVVQVVLLQLAFRNENGISPIPLISFCNLLKVSFEREHLIQAAKAIRVASKLGNVKATRIATQMTVDKRINKIIQPTDANLDDFNKGESGVPMSKTLLGLSSFRPGDKPR